MGQKGFDYVTELSATPNQRHRKSLLTTLPGLIAITSLIVAAAVIVSVNVYAMSTHDVRQSERMAQIGQLIAPDLAWRETERLKHYIDVELAGNGLALDANGLVVAGNEELLTAPRFEVFHEGKHVGYVSAENVAGFKLGTPYWLIFGCVILGALLCVALMRFAASRISDSLEQLTAFATAPTKQNTKPTPADNEFVEITKLRQAITKTLSSSEREMRRLRSTAFKDTITGLPNLNQLRDRMSAHAGSMSIEMPGAYVLLDLDGFIRASESFGPGGDRAILLSAISRIRSVLEDFETNGISSLLTSLQSDNFGLFIPLCPRGRDDVSAIVRRLNIAFEAPLAVGERLVSLGISGGIAMLPEDGSASEEIQRHAAMALQQARKSTRNGFQFYAPRFDRVAKGRFQLEEELRIASEREEFIPVFQPKIDFATGRIYGAEALARWRRDGGKIVMPGTFIGIAEEIGLIEAIGHQILTASCKAAAEWVRQGYNIPVAVNVSPRQFEQQDLTGVVIEALKQSGLPPHLLELEITESMAVEDPQKVADVMRPLRAMGVRLAIDDFGTGHSNLATLTQLPFDVFKIDRQFVSALQTDRQAPAIVEMILAMAETLGLKTVAEGVETEQQAEFLRRRGCTLGQGFLYSRGIPQDKFLELLHDWRGNNDDIMRQTGS